MVWTEKDHPTVGARQHILDGAVREILAEEAGRRTIIEWRISTNSVMLGEIWQVMGLILHTNRRREAIKGFLESRRGCLIWLRWGARWERWQKIYAIICASLMERGKQPDELIHDLKRRMQEAKNYKTQARKESIHVKISGPRTLTLESQF